MRSDYGISKDVAQIHNLFNLASPGFPPSANGGIIQHPDWKPRRHFWLPMYHALITKIFIMRSLCGKHGARSWVAKANKVYHTPFSCLSWEICLGSSTWFTELLPASSLHFTRTFTAPWRHVLALFVPLLTLSSVPVIPHHHTPQPLSALPNIWFLLRFGSGPSLGNLWLPCGQEVYLEVSKSMIFVSRVLLYALKWKKSGFKIVYIVQFSHNVVVYTIYYEKVYR